jgi:uncharacterized protein YbjT (DUF2867 family)
MAPPVLVTGGTGTLGRHVVPMLRGSGHDVRVLSRGDHESHDGISYARGDLVQDEGIPAALEGVEVLMHLAGSAKGDAVATANLVRAAAATDVRHVVYISVVGADRMPLGYFRSKEAAERVIAGSAVPWTTMRAAQFHDLVLTAMRGISRLPVVPAPAAVRFQSVEAAEVASRLVQLASGEPAGLVADLVGPEVHTMPTLARGYLQALGKHRLLLPLRVPGRVGAAYRSGANLTLEGAVVGKRTWADFLAERLRDEKRP